MANTDPEALKAAALAYERSNASLADYNPEDQTALDPHFLSTRGGVNTHPSEPITATANADPKVAKANSADKSLDEKVSAALKVQAKNSDSDVETARLKEAAASAQASADADKK